MFSFRTPAVRVRVPFIVLEPVNVRPPVRFKVKLRNPFSTPGKEIAPPAGFPITTSDVPPPVNDPLPIEIRPLRVSVFPFITRAPLVSVVKFVTETDCERVTPRGLFIVKLFTTAGRFDPVTCAAAPLYAKVVPAPFAFKV